jgi:ferritin-like protein
VSEYHEPDGELSDQARNFHRALTSLKEELEAVDWYNQRWDVSKDESLRAVIAHNRDEEIEHACMVLEWLRRNMPHWDDMLRTYLFTEVPITEVERKAETEEAPADLGLGSLRRRA